MTLKQQRVDVTDRVIGKMKNGKWNCTLIILQLEK